MSPKVLETWIDETLQDAEHLDIPGVILKPEHQSPVTRYGIDRISLVNAKIPAESVDRVYRSLYVYSVGFYELIRNLLKHTEKKYTMITSIWKVFAILLELFAFGRRPPLPLSTMSGTRFFALWLSSKRTQP